jgi:hypothetical protein
MLFVNRNAGVRPRQERTLLRIDEFLKVEIDENILTARSS